MSAFRQVGSAVGGAAAAAKDAAKAKLGGGPSRAALAAGCLAVHVYTLLTRHRHRPACSLQLGLLLRPAVAEALGQLPAHVRLDALEYGGVLHVQHLGQPLPQVVIQDALRQAQRVGALLGELARDLERARALVGANSAR